MCWCTFVRQWIGLMFSLATGENIIIETCNSIIPYFTIAFPGVALPGESTGEYWACEMRLIRTDAHLPELSWCVCSCSSCSYTYTRALYDYVVMSTSQLYNVINVLVTAITTLYINIIIDRDPHMLPAALSKCITADQLRSLACYTSRVQIIVFALFLTCYTVIFI